MEEAKSNNILSVSLYVPEEDRKDIPELNSGYDSNDKTWDLIVRYHGNIDSLKDYGAKITYLYSGYAVVNIGEENINRVFELAQIEYVEKPENIFYEVSAGKAASCFDGIMRGSLNLSGKGVIVAVIDSGADINHPDFIDDEGRSRILFLWDQSIEGSPPAGYNIGTEYTNSQLNEIISGKEGITKEGVLLPGYDASGHGTHVLGIAAGNGRASMGRNKGCAPDSMIILVKLAVGSGSSYPVTSLLIQAINYVIEKSLMLNAPAAINISYGNSYGSHNGSSLLETYINDVSGIGKNIIIIGSGNEAVAGKHAAASVGDVTEILIYRYTQPFGLQIWKNYIDEFMVKLTASNGNSIVFPIVYDTVEYIFEGVRIYVNYGLPTPYSINQEIYLQFVSDDIFRENQIWKIEMIPIKVQYGKYDMWLPAGNTSLTGTSFLQPEADITLTIPSTAAKAVTVGAYDERTSEIAFFSGRGFDLGGAIKPDIVAPGVNILSAAPGGGYTYKTGTSMAAPFVTGAAACLMQWGITDGNDLFMYGERIKANLIRGAKRIFREESYPSKKAGWGALCIKNSIPQE